MTTLKNRALFRQGLLGISSGLGILHTAIVFAFTSPAIPSMRNDTNFQLSDNEASWIGSIVPVSGLIGSLISGILVDSLGRNKLIILSIPPLFLGWALMSIAQSSFWVIGARLITGVCIGIQSVAGAVYGSECTPVHLRGRMALIRSMMWTLGLTFTNLSGKFFEWRGITRIAALLCLPFLLFRSFLPETPFFLLKSGRKSEALEAMIWLRDSPSIAKKELEEYASVNKSTEKPKTKFADLFVRPNRWPVAVAFLLVFFQQSSGMTPLTFYSTSVFESMKTSNSMLDPSTCSIIMNFVNIFANLSGNYLSAKLKRKRILKISSSLMVGALGSLFCYLHTSSTGGILEGMLPHLSFIPLLCILVYVIGFGIGWAALPFIFISEGLPSKVRGLASSLTLSLTWISVFIATKFHFSLEASLGLSGPFLVYTVMSFSGMVIMNFYLPETFGKTISEMDKFYSDTNKKVK